MSERENENRDSKSSILRKMVPGLLLGIVVMVGLTLLGDVRQVGELLQAFDWRIFPLAVFFTLFNYTLRFIKWQYYLHQVGVRGFSWRRSLQIFVAGFPLAVTPGKVGEVFKGIWLEQQTGLPVARGVSLIVAERVSDGLAVLMLSVLGVIAHPQYWPAFSIILVILLAGIIISQIRPLALGVLRLLERLPLVGRMVPALREFYEGSFILFRPQAALLGVGLGTISWFGEGVGFYFILTGLGMPTTLETFSNAVFILAFSTVVGAVSALPGGLGASEASIAGMLVLIGGALPATASAATVIIRLATLWFGVTLGLITWAFSPRLLNLQEERIVNVRGM
ncbi:MAG: lysylphosphatidylglycerol synthase transmembrane domain-containing protein [Chloroflexota bacterium]